MKITRVLLLVIFCFAVTIAVQAKKKGKKKTKGDLVLVEAYTQRVLPGLRRPQLPPPALHIVLVWERTDQPDDFFWRNDSTLLSCKIARAHKVTDRSYRTPPGMDYRLEIITGSQIHKGDTLMFSPVPIIGEKPVGIPDAGNTLFFKESTGNWYSYHIETITRKRDIAMP